MPENCVISNKTGTILVLNLPHGDVPEHASMGVVGVVESKIKRETVVNGRRHVEVERAIRAYKRPISGSVTLLAKGHKGDSATISRTALFAPDVKAAIKRGHVVVLSDEEAAEKKAVDAPTEPAKGRGKKE